MCMQIVSCHCVKASYATSTPKHMAEQLCQIWVLRTHITNDVILDSYKMPRMANIITLQASDD